MSPTEYLDSLAEQFVLDVAESAEQFLIGRHMRDNGITHDAATDRVVQETVHMSPIELVQHVFEQIAIESQHMAPTGP